MKYIFSYFLSFFCYMMVFSQETTEIYAENEFSNDEKVVEFGQRFADSFYEEDTSFFMDNFNLQSFAEKVVSINEKATKENAIKKFNAVFKNGIFLEKFHKFPEDIRAALARGASYSLVNFYYHLDERKYHLLFRMYSDNGGLNYHDYQLGYEDEKFHLNDVFIFTMGEYLSDTYQDLYELTIPGKDTKDTETNKERLKGMVYFARLKILLNTKKYKEALELTHNLTGDFTEKKIYYTTKIKIASKINNVYHLEAIDELLKKFPNDPYTKLMEIDYYVMLKDYNATMQLLDEIQQNTEDTFIEYVRGNAAWQFKDYELAEKAYANTIIEYPSFAEAKINLMYLYDFLEKHEDNIVLLNRMIENEEYDKKDLIDFIDDKSNEFVNLPNARIYNRWKKKK